MDAHDTSGTPPAGQQALERDIEMTRARLGRTTHLLAEKMDVKAQARRHAPVLAAAALTVAAVAALMIWRRQS